MELDESPIDGSNIIVIVSFFEHIVAATSVVGIAIVNAIIIIIFFICPSFWFVFPAMGGELFFPVAVLVPRPGRGGLMERSDIKTGRVGFSCQANRSLLRRHLITLPTLRVPPAMGGEYL